MLAVKITSLFFISTFFFSLQVRASFDIRELTLNEQIVFIKDFKATISQLEEIEAKAIVINSFSSLFLSFAYGATPESTGDYDCLYGGWPSSLYSAGNGSKYCAKPQLSSIYQKKNTCKSNELMCNPSLFGSSLCAPADTRDQRVRSFANCEKLFKSQKRNLSKIVREMSESDKDDFNLLVDLVEKVCIDGLGTQKGKGVCQVMLAKMNTIKPLTVKKQDVVVTSCIPPISGRVVINELAEDLKKITKEMTSVKPVTPMVEQPLNCYDHKLDDVYKKIQGNSANIPDLNVFKDAYTGYLNIKNKRAVAKSRYLTIVDYTKPESQKRLYVIDLEKHKVLYHTRVGHAFNADKTGNDGIPDYFEDSSGKKSSLFGHFITGAKKSKSDYSYAMYIDGLDPFNKGARGDAKIVHGNNPKSYELENVNTSKRHYHDPTYMPEFISSDGCFSIPSRERISSQSQEFVAEAVVNTINGGSVYYVHVGDDVKETRTGSRLSSSAYQDKKKAAQILGCNH